MSNDITDISVTESMPDFDALVNEAVNSFRANSETDRIVIRFVLSNESILFDMLISDIVDDYIPRRIKRSPKALSHLDSYRKVKNDDPLLDEECIICGENYKSGEYKRVLPKCKHTFHKRCVDKWLKVADRMDCPVCREDYSPPEDKCDCCGEEIEVKETSTEDTRGVE